MFLDAIDQRSPQLKGEFYPSTSLHATDLTHSWIERAWEELRSPKGLHQAPSQIFHQALRSPDQKVANKTHQMVAFQTAVWRPMNLVLKEGSPSNRWLKPEVGLVYRLDDVR
jgi:hypothetical protein